MMSLPYLLTYDADRAWKLEVYARADLLLTVCYPLPHR
jgi:hypothetical protein